MDRGDHLPTSSSGLCTASVERCWSTHVAKIPDGCASSSVRGACGVSAAVLNPHHPVTRERGRGVVGDGQRGPALGQGLERAEHLGGGLRIESCGRLVEDHPRARAVTSRGRWRCSLALMPGSLQLFILTAGRRLWRSDLFPRCERIAVTGINSEVFHQTSLCLCRHTADREVNGGRRGGKIIVVIVPDQNFDFVFLPRRYHVDVRPSANSGTHHFLKG